MGILGCGAECSTRWRRGFSDLNDRQKSKGRLVLVVSSLDAKAEARMGHSEPGARGLFAVEVGLFEVFVAFFDGGYGFWLEFFEEGQETPGIEGFHGVIGILAGGIPRAADENDGDFRLQLFKRRDQFLGGHVFHTGVHDDPVEGGIFLEGDDGFLAAVGGDDVEFRGFYDEFSRGDAAGGFAVDHEVAGSDHASIVGGGGRIGYAAGPAEGNSGFPRGITDRWGRNDFGMEKPRSENQTWGNLISQGWGLRQPPAKARAWRGRSPGARRALVFSQVLHWGDDGDASKWIENEQVLVAGENQVGMAIDGKCQEFVVLGVAADLDLGEDFDLLRGASYPVQKWRGFALVDVAAEFSAIQDIAELKQGW